MAVSVVSFSFSWCSTGGPEAHSAGWWLSLMHLISNFSGPQTPSGFPKAPLAGCGFPYYNSSITPSDSNLNCNLTSVLTELYNISTPTRSPNRSLEWHDWSSSSGNNCHAVHRSLSSGASVYECIMGFTLSHFICQIHPRDLFRLLAIGMCHFLPVHHFVMACLLGPKVKIQHVRLWSEIRLHVLRLRCQGMFRFLDHSSLNTISYCCSWRLICKINKINGVDRFENRIPYWKCLLWIRERVSQKEWRLQIFVLICINNIDTCSCVCRRTVFMSVFTDVLYIYIYIYIMNIH